VLSAVIWDALKAACEADLQTALLIVNSAGIIVTVSDLSTCFDKRVSVWLSVWLTQLGCQNLCSHASWWCTPAFQLSTCCTSLKYVACCCQYLASLAFKGGLCLTGDQKHQKHIDIVWWQSWQQPCMSSSSLVVHLCNSICASLAIPCR